MGKRDDLIAKYARDLRELCGLEPDMPLLEKVTIACGPAIYDPETEVLAPGDAAELGQLRRNFVQRRLGVTDAAEADDAIRFVLESYGPAGAPKYRAVVHYMLVKHFGRADVFA